jgi:hypothetical protein
MPTRKFRTKQNLKVIKCYRSKRPLVCTSARPPRKHFDQEPSQMPIRRAVVRTAPGSYKVVLAREACDWRWSPVG